MNNKTKFSQGKSGKNIEGIRRTTGTAIIVTLIYYSFSTFSINLIFLLSKSTKNGCHFAIFGKSQTSVDRAYEMIQECCRNYGMIIK